MRVAIICTFVVLVACEGRTSYEVLQATTKDVMPSAVEPRFHRGIDYVLSHEGHKIYASCDATLAAATDPSATCELLVLRSYKCEVGSDRDLLHKIHPADLVCKDHDGHNVYLNVSKEQ